MVLLTSPTDLGCELLEWDSRFFGKRIARLHAHDVTPVSLTRARQWCADQSVECLYVLVDAQDRDAVATLENNGVPCVDERLTLERAVAAGDLTSPLDARIRSLRERDISRLGAIAASSHGDTRFYADVRFPRERCDALYRTWIEKSCADGSTTVFVATDKADDPVGYLTLERPGPTIGQIGLIAVHSDARSAGLGGALVTAALRLCAEQQRTTVRVITQERNTAARRLYAARGFVSIGHDRWYHVWNQIPSGARESHVA